MALTGRVEVEVDTVRGSFRGSFTGATAKLIAAYEEFDDICMEELEDAAEDASEMLITQWRHWAPVRTGEYRDSLHKDVEVVGPEEVWFDVWNDAFHSEFVERGTAQGGTGYIYAFGKNMRFKPDGEASARWVSAPRVRGQRAQRVGQRSHAAARPLMMQRFREATDKATDRLKAIL